MVRRTVCAVMVLILSLMQGTWHEQRPEIAGTAAAQYESRNDETEISLEQAEVSTKSASAANASYGKPNYPRRHRNDDNKGLSEGEAPSRSLSENEEVVIRSTDIVSGRSGSTRKDRGEGKSDNSGSYRDDTRGHSDNSPEENKERMPDSVSVPSSGGNNMPEQDLKQGNAADPGPASTETDDTPETEAVHVHQWVTETIHRDAVTHTEHHDKVTEERWVSVPVTVTRYYCDVCGAEFSSQSEAYAHEDATYARAMETGDMSLIHSGHYSNTETTDNGYWETVTIREAYDETVTDVPAWDEYVTVCRDCGAEY